MHVHAHSQGQSVGHGLQLALIVVEVVGLEPHQQDEVFRGGGHFTSEGRHSVLE